MLHKHFTPEQRNELSAFLRAGLKKKDVAKCLSKDRATIWRELRRNGSANGKYYVRKAKRLTKERNSWLRNYVVRKLKKYWSPRRR